MKKYQVKVTPEAISDLKRYIAYIQNRFNNDQAAKSLAEDFRSTKTTLADLAGSIKEPDSPKLRQRCLKRINFKKHDYFLLFRITDDIVEITNVFHQREDFENKLR